MKRIKELPRWIGWNLKEINGRRTKIPCAANGMPTGTSAEYAHTWVTYEEAAKAAAERSFTGIGFVILENVVFLDKDHIDPNDPYVAKLRCFRISLPITLAALPTATPLKRNS